MQGEIEFGVVNQSQSAFSHILSDVSLIVYQARPPMLACTPGPLRNALPPPSDPNPRTLPCPWRARCLRVSLVLRQVLQHVATSENVAGLGDHHIS